jgi:LmbE family N-acetylglucosaminyl deacetylase
MTIRSKATSVTTNSAKTQSRRDFINQTIGGIAFMGATGSGVLTGDAHQNINGKTGARKLKIVVTGSHPGDPEYGCGGTIASYTDMGHEAVLLYLNRGEAGINGKSFTEAAKIRTAEAMHACEILNARAVFATQIDGQSVVDIPHYKEVYEILAKEQPDIIFTQWPIDNHPDHRALSTLVYNAWQLLRESKPSSQPVLYFYEVSNGEDTLMFSPTYYVDITALESRKQKACFSHASQSPEMFYSLQEQVSRFRGLECGCKQAEAFILHVKSYTGLLSGSH